MVRAMGQQLDDDGIVEVDMLWLWTGVGWL